MPDLNSIQPLISEAQQLANAIDNLEHDGRIVNMSIAPPAPVFPPIEPPAEGAPPAPPPPPAPPVMRPMASVNTSTMEYPQAMVTAIVGMLRTRQNAVKSELAALGVTLPTS